jgi:hypothetical protein
MKLKLDFAVVSTAYKLQINCGIEYKICHITGYITEILRYSLKDLKMDKESTS